nr:hypothetical protein [Tanacetum cinerariifolium]
MSKCARTGRSTKGHDSSSQEPTIKDKVYKFGVFDNDTHQGYYDTISRRLIQPGIIIEWAFFTTHGLARNFFDSINTNAFIGPQWANLSQIDEPVFCELVWEFFTSFKFSFVACRGETVKADHVLMQFWPNIRDDDFVVGGMAIKSEWVTCNIPYCLSRYLEKVKEKDLLVGGMFVTKIAKSFGLLTNLMVDALSVEPRLHVFKNNFLIAMGIVMDLGGGTCCWPTTRQVREDDAVEEAANEEAGGSAEVYRNMN